MKKTLMTHDSPAKISACLRCTKPQCNNCHAHAGSGLRGRPKKPVVRIDDDGRKVYPTALEAAQEMHVSMTAIRNAVLYGRSCCGYRWEYEGGQ